MKIPISLLAHFKALPPIACVCHRKYWTCGSTGSTCGFFEWTPSKAVILSQQSDIATPATGGSGTGHASQNGEYAVDGSQTGPSCHCGLPVRRSSIKAGPNAGRCTSFPCLMKCFILELPPESRRSVAASFTCLFTAQDKGSIASHNSLQNGGWLLMVSNECSDLQRQAFLPQWR